MTLHRMYYGRGTKNGSRVYLALAGGSLLLGILLGRWMYTLTMSGADPQLAEYLQGYGRLLSQNGASPASFFSALAVYFRCPAVLFFLGFTSLGLILAPVLCAVQGFLLSFAVTAFFQSVECGAWLAVAALGVRCIFTLPCILWLAVWAMERTGRFHRGTSVRRSGRSAPGDVCANRLAVCVVILLVGVVLEVGLVPKLFRLILESV